MSVPLPSSTFTVMGLAASWAQTHPFRDDPDRRPFPPDAWNLAFWHSQDNPKHILGPFDTDDGNQGMECECGVEFVNPPWMSLLYGGDTP